MRRGLLALLLAALGCDGATVGPDDPPVLLPDVAGEWSGTFQGEVGLVGASGRVVRDTFRLVFDIRQDRAEASYNGEFLRGGAEPEYLYGCGAGTFAVAEDGRVPLRCVQQTQLDEALVLRVRARVDPAVGTMRGVVYDVLGAEGAEYGVVLRRDDG